VRRVVRFMQRAVRPRSSAVILMYHRVAEPACDPWNLAVSLDNFDQQMQVLRRNRRPLPMRQLVEGLRVGDLPERAVAVTFDDGYMDNLVNAKPTGSQRQFFLRLVLSAGLTNIGGTNLPASFS
jgi:hypothetical protein